MDKTTPATEYRSRLARWEQDRQRQHRQYRLLGNVRLGTGLLFALLAALSLGAEWISAWWMLVPLVGLFILGLVLARTERAWQRASRAVTFYGRGLARLEDRWIGEGNASLELRPADHLYAEDLDLFGPGSLFALLATGRTGTGDRTLASWLLAPADREVVVARQEAVAELAPRLDLREDLALLGDDIRAAIDDRLLEEWGAGPHVKFFPGARWVLGVLGAAGFTALVLWLAGAATLLPLLVVVLFELSAGMLLQHSVEQVTGGVNSPARELRLIAQMLGRLETEKVETPALRALQRRMTAGGFNATKQIERLERMVERMEWGHNQMFGVIAWPLMWIPQFAISIEAWRQQCGPLLGDWVRAAAEFEALLALATFSYERPEAVFPELLDSGVDRGLEYRAEGLLHPLIPRAEAVANDVALGGTERMWIVSGSNMSGKSTLLRAIGVSVALGWAGAPVTAQSLAMTRLEVGASLRTSDSLTDNRSRFYAEISRLKAIADRAKAGCPVLFLLDELLSGTNSHDRRIGADALLNGLVERGAIGLATTHDLALAEIAERMGEKARNVHLEDHLEGGEIRFDYRLRPGVVERSNAIQLMRAVGLDV